MVVAECYFEQELRRVVGGRQDDVRGERVGLRGEVGAEIRLGDHVDLDARTLKDHHSIGGRLRRDTAHCQVFQILGVSGLAEDADARYYSTLVSARGQGFEQEAIGFVAAAVGRVVERILGEKNFEPRMNADERG